MDAKQLGTFIAGRRKELGMTQANLADILHVTDKAVSRWERGLGFPDISSLEPLASALEISIAELMQAKQNESESISREVVNQLLIDTIKLKKEQNRAVKIGGTVILSILSALAVAVICLLISDFRVLLFPAGSIVAGLVAWAVPVYQAAISKSSDFKRAHLISFSFALLSTVIQFLYIANRVRIGDIGGVEDTIVATVTVVFIFSFATVLINAVTGLINKKKN